MDILLRDLILVHFDEEGNITYHITGDRCRVFVVDERAPDDRVYEILSRDEPESLGEVIGASPIGSSKDKRHEDVTAKIEDFIPGEHSGKPKSDKPH